MRAILIRLSVAVLCVSMHMGICSAQGSGSSEVFDRLWTLRNSRLVPVKGSAIEIFDVKTPRTEVGVRLFSVKEHPAIDQLMTDEIKEQILREINLRCDKLGKDTLLTADLFWVSRPYFDWLHTVDPHYRIEERVPVKNIRDIKKLKVPAFDVLCINDTVIINRSLDKNFLFGDRILSINGVEMPEYLKYNYSDRYNKPADIMHYYYYSDAANKFVIKLERNGSILEQEAIGENPDVVSVRLTQQNELTSKKFADAKCGYISIPKFYFDNSRLIKIVSTTIRKFKELGLNNIILDLRMNPGGNGDRFDDLLSIFINKPVIEYLKSSKIKSSKKAQEIYDFLPDETFGSLVDMPENEIVKKFTTNPKMFIGEMTYYVLMSKDTGSIAASFCNMLQYNGAARLVGEPLLPNALKYGETIPGKTILPTLLQASSVSIVEFDEHTKAVGGVLTPDIPIPYVAADYLSGEDGMLEKLLKIIVAK